MKTNTKKIIFLIVFLIFFTILVLNMYKVMIAMIDVKKIEDTMIQIDTKIIVEDSITKNYTELDLDSLKNINSDTVGWITVKGTNISYPIVQAKDNEYYLTHSFDKKNSVAGWIFADYRVKPFKSKNTIIYGHSGLDKVMFNSLINVVTTKWLSNEDNFTIKINNMNEELSYRVFSIYRIKNTTDYLEVDFSDDSSYADFLNMILKRSDYPMGVGVSTSDSIITLSTCYKTKERLVVHAKLVK